MGLSWGGEVTLLMGVGGHLIDRVTTGGSSDFGNSPQFSMLHILEIIAL